MIKLPNLEKSANLEIEIREGIISAFLVYSDYSIGRHYVLNDRVVLKHGSLTTNMFADYLLNLEKKLSWNLFRAGSGDVMTFSDEGFGVNSIHVLIDSRTLDNDLIAEIRSVSTEISVSVLNQKYIKDMLAGIGERLGYEDVFLFDLDLSNTYVYRSKKVRTGKKLNTPREEKTEFSVGKIEWGNDWKLVDAVNSAKMNAFISESVPQARIENTWANYVVGRAQMKSPLVQDLLRSYTSLQLLTIRNDNGKAFDNGGNTEYSTLVLVTGRTVNSMDQTDILYSIIDAMELNDVVDMGIDSNQSIYTLAYRFAKGIASSGYLVEMHDFVDRMDQILIPDVANRGKKKRVIFDGEVMSDDGSRRDIYALSDEFTQIMLNESMKHFEVTGKFIKDSSLYSQQNFSFIGSKRGFKSIIIDARYRPIVYGPEPKDNKIKMSSWVNVPII